MPYNTSIPYNTTILLNIISCTNNIFFFMIYHIIYSFLLQFSLFSLLSFSLFYIISYLYNFRFKGFWLKGISPTLSKAMTAQKNLLS